MSDRKRNWLHRLFSDTSAHPNDALGDALDELAEPHPHFTALTFDQGMNFEHTVISAFNEHGYQADVNGTDLRITSRSGKEQHVNLTNLYREVAQLEAIDEDMDMVVRDYVGNMMAVRSAADYREADFYRGMRVRLLPIPHLETESWAMEALGLTGAGDVQLDSEKIEALFTPDSPIQPFSEDTVVHLSFDTENAVQALSPELLDDRGPVEDLYRMGYRNLWQELVDSDLKVVEFTPDAEQSFRSTHVGALPPELRNNEAGESCWMIESSSFYGGSIPLFLEEFMDRYLPQVDRSNGVIFAMPHRHLTLVKNVTNGAELMNSIGLMVSLTAEEFSHQPGGLSPRLHLWHEGQVQTFTDIVWGTDERQAEIQVKPSPYLMAKISEGLDGPDGPEDPGTTLGPR
ncbi:MAG TPA: hypothetical protein H9867_05315 [Candidatus Corynebacterium gallistercoris]|uniref:Uncharacterized protein n=1 Tax=Candidatus Corynebacterium gallistercoris TaxID=2838530 RepID=A0A9D1RY66_9CORY|nr:hypothetical protein [Candidatus Corynebacterium gallistercoris]